jgi:L-threonylcarbamoyladenylate synthase
MRSGLERLQDDDRGLRAAAAILGRGGIVAFPTRSFYGLGARADSQAAVDRLVELKSRERKPIPLIAATAADVERIGRVPELLAPLVRAFWPGPLTVAIPPTGEWPAALAGDAGTIGVRIPGHLSARRLAATAGGLLTASSANRAGQPPPVRPGDFDPLLEIDAVVDGGELAGGKPSTVVGVCGPRVVLFRAGAVSLSDLERVLGRPVGG